MINRLLIILTRDQAGFVTGYNSPFPSSKNSRFNNEAKGKVKRATNCYRTSPEAMLSVLLPIISNLSCSK